MSLVYQLEHYGAVSVDLEKIGRLVGDDLLGSADFRVSIAEPDKFLVTVTDTVASRVAFAKVVQYLCETSDSIVLSRTRG